MDKKPLFIATADIHVHHETPRSRTDDYLQAVSAKLDFVTAEANKYGVPVIDAGDIFDVAMPKPESISAVINHLNPEAGLFTIAGNHDLKNHNYDLFDKTGVKVIGSTSGCTVVGPYEVVETDTMLIAGMPFGFYDLPADVFEGYPTNKKRVGMIHILTYTDGDIPFHGCTAKSIQRLSAKYSQLDYLVSGDNHQRFAHDNKTTLCINPGSLMRRNSTQKEYQPKVFLVYDDFSFETIDVPIVEGVIDDTFIVAKKEKDDKLESYISSQVDGAELSLFFPDNMLKFIAANELEPKVVLAIQQAMED